MRIDDARVCLWFTAAAGVAFVVAFLLFPGFLPPMSPEAPAGEVAAFYRDNTGLIRVSMILFNVVGVMLVPFYALIVTLMQRMARASHVLAFAYLAAAVGGTALFALADVLWLVPTFRPARDPELVQLLNDFAWFVFVAPVGMLIAQTLSLAVGIFFDDRDRPVFPRWVAYFNLVIAVAVLPGAFSVMYRTGPFAWDGALAFWGRVGAFAAYVTVMWVVTWRTTTRMKDGENHAPAGRSEAVAV